ncbi:MAG: SCO family protein [Alphaproteobacteria bacterium]|nr:SCO family protein [Alphaproteobacteria bacterium]
MKTALVSVLALIAILTTSPARAERSVIQPSAFADLGFAQHPGAQVPLDVGLRDEQGRPVRLGDYVHGLPVVLVLDYLHCPNLCGLVLGDLARALQGLTHAEMRAGRDYQVIALSIDPHETPEDARAAHEKYGPQFSETAQWHFLIGDAAAVKTVADAIGFRYRYDDSIGQYAHPSGVTILGPSGRVARYILGVDYHPVDLRLSLTEAEAGEVSAPASQLLLLCYCYDPQTGRYSLAVGRLLQAAGLLTVLMIAIPVYRALRREQRG